MTKAECFVVLAMKRVASSRHPEQLLKTEVQRILHQTDGADDDDR